MNGIKEDDIQIAIDAMAPAIKRYANLIVKVGLNVQKGQEVVINAPIEATEFTHLVVEEAYKAGAEHVTVVWDDQELSKINYTYTPLSWFKKVPSWKVELLNSMAKAGACFLFLDGDSPDALIGIDQEKVAAGRMAQNTQCSEWRHRIDFSYNVWCVVGAPTYAWAKKVFPDKSDDKALLSLWEAVLDVCRVTEDPISAWETHNATFNKNKRALNGYQFDALHYKSSNGTDLTIGMNKNHIWEGGAFATQSGLPYFPNMPTEEVFSSPDRNRADGIVYATMPLANNGSLIKDFWFKFEGGKVVDYGASEGLDVLKHILETDEGAKHLGECALISKLTPIRQHNILFYNTLFDENASCHLAIGTGFPECLEGGFEMTKDELCEAGVNKSVQHLDFMIGADDLDVTGITKDGAEVPIFTNGLWAWE